MDANQVVSRYIGAWCETDPELRQKILDEVWDENGSYTDPMASVEGKAALVNHISGFHQQFPGARIELTSAIDAHHNRLRFTWRMVLADQSVFLEGVDFSEIGSDGKLRYVVGFFGPLGAL